MWYETGVSMKTLITFMKGMLFSVIPIIYTLVVIPCGQVEAFLMLLECSDKGFNGEKVDESVDTFIAFAIWKII